MFKAIIRSLLQKKVKKYFKRHTIKLIVVTGSVGKTSTKQAIATVLSEGLRVRAHDGNYNTDLSVPVALMGVDYPDNPHSVREWMQVFDAMSIRINEPQDVDVIIQELGTDHPGDVAAFASYLQPDIAVVTAISEEHMEYFKTLDAVAQEELSVLAFSKLAVVNRDDVAGGYAKYASTTNITTYGLDEKAEYRLEVQPASPLDGRIGKLHAPEWGEIPVTVQLVGEHSLKAAAAAACVASRLGMSVQEIAVGISKIRPVKGRMRVFRGVNDSTIIDDTYNASPLAVKAALTTLYTIEAPQRIAVLGSMNELGETSATAHAEIGTFCASDKLEWVVTIGEEARKYLAPAAERQACRVRSFTSPYEAGGFVHSVLQEKGVVLVKGSQNGVFAEETVKILLHSTEDEEHLVRQSEAWMKKKQDQFSYFKSEAVDEAGNAE